MIRTPIFLLYSFVFCSQVLFAHGDLHERILLLTSEINAKPNDANLYFERAKLYFYHNEFNLSILDLDTSDKLGLKDPLTHLFYAKAHQKLNNHKVALAYAEQILAHDSKNVNALKIKAQVQHSLEKYAESAESYALLINTTKRALPENYLDGAKSWIDANNTTKAILLIDQGIHDLGELPAFLRKKKEYLVENEMYKDAFLVQKLIIANAQRKERAHYEAAEIALLLKDFDLAAKHLNKSEKAFHALPIRIQNNKAMRELAASIKNTKTKLSNHL